MEGITWTTQVVIREKESQKRACITFVPLADSRRGQPGGLAISHSAGLTFQSVTS